MLFDSEKEFREYAPGETTAGLYQSGLERDYIVTYAGGELPRVVTHEFVHFLLHQTPAPLPRWFEEGTAELYSNTQINSKRVRIGKDIESHTNLLLARPWLTAKQLAAERPEATTPDQEQAESMFYAESWALVHMLNLSPDYRDHMPQYIMLLANGTDAPEAFRMAFGARFRAGAGRTAGVSQEDPQRASWIFLRPRPSWPANPSRYQTWTRLCCAPTSRCAAAWRTRLAACSSRPRGSIPIRPPRKPDWECSP